MKENNQTDRIFNAAVIVAALGYFVDIYDLLLFGFVRVKSLTALGYSGQDLTDITANVLHGLKPVFFHCAVLPGKYSERLRHRIYGLRAVSLFGRCWPGW